MILSARDLRKTYGKTPALDGAEFAIERGEVVAVMGPSGSGKSTLLHCIAGIITPDGPMIATTSPASISKSALTSAGVWP